MINLNRLGIGGIIFLIGAVIYVINLAVPRQNSFAFTFNNLGSGV